MAEFSSAFKRWLILCVVLFPIAQGSCPLSMDTTTATTPTPKIMHDAQKKAGVSLRLYLVRHGETLANIQKIVVGQSDSSLTMLGQRQARALGQSFFLKNTAFWRRYASDLERAQHTARLIDGSQAFQPDERLREIAKGARQGFPKSYTLDQCMEWFRERPEEIPKQETSADAWKRLSRFLLELFQETLQEDDDDSEHVERRNVLVVCHSGSLRLLLHKLVPHAHPLLQVSSDTTGALDDSKRFQIPNTSLTIMDLTIPNTISIADLEEDVWMKLVTPKLAELNWIGHYDDL
jgi:broad specificity phosphatase PhoE